MDMAGYTRSSESRASIFAALIFLVLFISSSRVPAQTIACWLFDEQAGLYPSCVLNDAGPNDYPLVLGPGGELVPGRFGNALSAAEQPGHMLVRQALSAKGEELSEGSFFGYTKTPVPPGRTIEPMDWMNANFCALMTSGENHLRKESGFGRATLTGLNLGAFDWTVEFWYLPAPSPAGEGIVFEIGRGPRGENDEVTRLVLDSGRKGFILLNQPSGTRLYIPSDRHALDQAHPAWHHFAFVYSTQEQQLTHFVDGKIQKRAPQCALQALAAGEEDYFSIGRDGLWQRPLPGKLDELRFSLGRLYQGKFTPPNGFSQPAHSPALKTGLPLLFVPGAAQAGAVQLGGRKYLFLDDALLEKMDHITFTVNPPAVQECVIDSIEGPFRKHVSVIEDENGLIRMYYGGPDDFFEVRTSRDGVHWEIPDLTPPYKGRKNYALLESTAMGNIFIDPNAPPQARWKLISDFNRRGIFLYSSPDGWSFTRKKTSILPFRSGSQSNTFFDEQCGCYRSYHRSDLGATPSGKSQRMFVLTETREIDKPWPFTPLDLAATQEKSKSIRLRQPIPHYLDNGPLTPGGFGVEYPVIFAHEEAIDPLATDIYVPKVHKYPWAPDAYIAFPLLYFHYEDDGPLTRRILMHPDRGRGSGAVETQISVSRDGLHWRRYPRPAYVGIGRYGLHDLHQIYMAHGMVRRGDEIWQYFFGETRYHSSRLKENKCVRAVYRTVQRLDGFVSADAPYDREGLIVTRPLVFKGNRLVLNIDTDAAGYAQVGLLDEKGDPIPGYSVDQCVYINGDFIASEVEWITNQDTVGGIEGKSDEELFAESRKLIFNKDLAELQGKTIQVVIRMRGAKLYALQFTEK
jgi:hypothetical protein